MSFQFSLQDAFDLAERKVGVPGWVAYKWQDAVMMADALLAALEEPQP